MLTVFFGGLAIICAFGWVINRIVAKGLILYIIEECGRVPVSGELRPYMKKTVKRMFSKKS